MFQIHLLPSLLAFEAQCIENAKYTVECDQDMQDMNQLANDYWGAGAEVLRRLSSVDAD